jgi:hypothetical protein
VFLSAVAYPGLLKWWGQIMAFGNVEPRVLAPPCMAKGRARGGCREGVAPPAMEVWGYNPRKILKISYATSWILVHLPAFTRLGYFDFTGRAMV